MNINIAMSKTKKTTSVSKKSIEDTYKKLSSRKHILHRPDTVVGSIEKEKTGLWIYNEKKNAGDAEFIFKEIVYIPGLYKIFDEILVNARDHYITCIDDNQENVTMIKVNIDKELGRITVWNNGAGIPVVEHPKYKILIPSMLFGDLRSSTNYDDDKKRKVGGRNGYGAKLTNILSTEFIIETLDSINNKKFIQVFKNNMSEKGTPKISSGNGKKSYTKISFTPDYERFGIKGLTSDVIALFKKRVYDIAMNVKAKIYYNDKLITNNSFSKYIDLYFPENTDYKKVMDISDENWKVCVVYDPTDKLDHQNISFVNGISTSRGGTHLEHVSNQIVNKIKDSISKKAKDLIIKPAMIKENLIFFVDAVVINPEFDTQTKEFCKTSISKFEFTYTAPETFLKKIIQTGVIDTIIQNAEAKADIALVRAGGGKKGPIRYEKYYPAHKSGTKEADKCTLIITEGDSAKTFALSGLNVVGRDYYGVIPIRGKFLNVREISKQKVIENKEVEALMKIIGLVPGKKYTDLKSLRYGKIMILTDQDTDGYHIKGLLMNFIHYFWPSLVKFNGFIQSFATPLLKATKKGKGKNREIIEFTNPQSYEEWKNKNNDGKGWDIKYFKGLGTSKPAEAQECFTDLNEKIIKYYWQSNLTTNSEVEGDDNDDNNENNENKTKKKQLSSQLIDEESDITSDEYKPKNKDISEDAITLAFDKKRANDRKIWVNSFDPNVYIDTAQKNVSFYEFIHNEMRCFSVDDNLRSIPNIIDGFKPVQRKVFYGSNKEGIYKKEIKVSELQGAVSKLTKYHHGESSLSGTIIKMAQNYVGSNNINLLMPNGQFGSRLCGGEDSAAPRYLNTQLDMLNQKIFRDEDFDILEQQTEDNVKIEPVFYAPVIPMILVNGTEGIGTGYSSSVEPCNPRDIYANLKRIIAGEKPKAMKPWYRHFTGTIEKIDKNDFISRAKYEIINDDTIHITDLPIGVWTDNYKAFLDNLLNQGAFEKKEQKKDAKNKSSVNSTNKTGSKTKGKNKSSAKKSKFLKDKSKKSATARVAKKNAIASAIKTYTENCTEIRISFTIIFHPGKLKTFIKNGKLEKNLKLVRALKLTNMHLFNEHGKIKKYGSYGAILKNFAKVRLDLYQKRKDYLLDKWKNEMDILKWKLKFVEAVIADEIIIHKKSTKQLNELLEHLKYPQFIFGDKKLPSYDYLTSITVGKLCTDEVKKLRELIKNKKEDIQTLESKSPSDIWDEELEEFMEAYEKWESECNIEFNNLISQKKNTSVSKKKRKNNVNKKVEI